MPPDPGGTSLNDSVCNSAGVGCDAFEDDAAVDR